MKKKLNQSGKSKINWKEHKTCYIGLCKCSNHHYHIIKVGSAIYLQCGKCGELTNVIIDYHLKNV